MENWWALVFLLRANKGNSWSNQTVTIQQPCSNLRLFSFQRDSHYCRTSMFRHEYAVWEAQPLVLYRVCFTHKDFSFKFHLLFLVGGMPFIDVPTPISSASSEAASAVVSPSIDSGLEFSSQTASKEDLTDLEQPGSPRESTAAEPGSSELGVSDQPDHQVWLWFFFFFPSTVTFRSCIQALT
jgi:hypothetical protein